MRKGYIENHIEEIFNFVSDLNVIRSEMDMEFTEACIDNGVSSLGKIPESFAMVQMEAFVRAQLPDELNRLVYHFL